jgi:hypothetical protein
MKLKSANISSSRDFPLLKHMWTGESLEMHEEDAFGGKLISDKTKSILLEIEKRFAEIKAKSENSEFLPKKLIQTEQGYLAPKGMVFHALLLGELDEFIDKMKSISENGLLASEWFGMRYEINEVPYRVSFHSITEDTQINELKTYNQTTRDQKQITDRTFALFVDYENELLKPLTDIDPLNVTDLPNHPDENLVRGLLDSAAGLTFGTCCPNHRKERVENHAMKDLEQTRRVRERGGNFKVHHSILKNNEFDFDENCVQSFENAWYKYSYNRWDEQLSGAPPQSKYYKFIPAGVPSKFINGILIPKTLESHTELISELKSLFPQAVFFNSVGKEIGITSPEVELQ